LGFSPLQVFRSNHPFIRFFASVKLTIVLLVLIGLACILGTLIPQADSVGGSPVEIYNFYINRYGTFLHRLFNAFSFYRLYSCWWFSLLLFALTINMVVCSLRRLRWRRDQVGFQLTHLSIVFLLAGVLVGLNSREGSMQIDTGAQSDTLVERPHVPVANSFEQAQQLMAESSHAAEGGPFPELQLPFAIHLDQFELKRERKPLDILRVQSRTDERVLSYNIAFQRRVARATGEPWDIDILQTSPVLTRATQVVERENALAHPAVEVEFGTPEHHHTDWVFADGPSQRRALAEDCDIEYRRCRTRAQIASLLAEKTILTTSTPDLLEVTGAGAQPTTWPLRLGVEQPIKGTGVSVTVLKFFPHWNMDPRTHQVYSLSNERRNPAIQVMVRRGDAGETKWLFSRMPSFHGQREFDLTTMTLRFVEGDVRRAHALRALAADDSKERFLEHYFNGQWVETVSGDTSRPIVLPNGFQVRAVRWLEHAVVESREETDPDRFVARIRLRNRTTGRTEEIELPTDNIIHRGDLRFALVREYPIEQYISHIRVIEDGRTVLTKAIQMNDPLKYQGYTFYQSSYDSEAGEASRYTVLSAKRDPGVWFVYVGFGSLTLGLVIVFYVNPWLKRKRGTMNNER